MRAAAAVLFLSLASAAPAQLLDRTVAVVGSRPITATEVELQMRLQALFNEVPLDLSDKARATALERLVEQRLVETDMSLAGLPPVEAREADGAFAQLRQNRFGGLSFDEALDRYGLKERDAREFLLRQLRFARYVQFRFRAGLQADEESIRQAYDRRFAGVIPAPALDDVRDELREQVLNQKAERMLDERVRQLRAETRVAYLDPIEPEPEAVP